MCPLCQRCEQKLEKVSTPLGVCGVQTTEDSEGLADEGEREGPDGEEERCHLRGTLPRL